MTAKTRHNGTGAGRPVEWFTRARPDKREQTKLRKARNQMLTCGCPGCSKKRDGLSPVCSTHSERMQDAGDPIARLPHRHELQVIDKALDLYLERLKATEPNRLAEIEIELSFQARKMTRPEGWAAAPGAIHQRVTRQGRAEIVKAWVAKHGDDFREAIRRALVIEAWTAILFDGLPKYRRKFIETQAGVWFSRHGTPSKTISTTIPVRDTTTVVYGRNGPTHPLTWEAQEVRHTKEISGTVRRVLGAEALEAAHSAFGPNFWDNAVTLKDGQQLRLLDLARQALRAAKLH